MVGVIYVHRRRAILDANSRARAILRQGDGLADRCGMLRARSATDDPRIRKLLADAVPRGRRRAVGGSTTVERSADGSAAGQPSQS